MPRTGAGAPRRYQRKDRLNELLREVVAEELERVSEDDKRLRFVTVTGVETHDDLQDATVFFTALRPEQEVLPALEAVRHRLQKAIAGQVRARRTPILRFRPDSGVLGGRRIDEVLRTNPARTDEVQVDESAYKDLEDI